jgi:hypothetical protein
MPTIAARISKPSAREAFAGLNAQKTIQHADTAIAGETTKMSLGQTRIAPFIIDMVYSHGRSIMELMWL